MDEEIERLVVAVRADTTGLARDVDAMRGQLEGPLAAGADRAGRAIETTLLRAARTGSLGFEDLRRTALSVLGEVAAAQVRGAVGVATGGQGVGASLLGLLGGLVGAPGRATGGPVSPGRPYWVGERGPELFVPTSSGSVAAASAPAGAREVRVSIAVQAGGGDAPRALAASGRQVARAVKAALEG
ncbi:tail tape measure protein [Sphingomonas aracearum]|uniref:Tail tape measure protein n=1 Tax=Sphingomonas aracearum TaxID=2283317 RepID=A0A369VYA4_9SPHN|nr:tail tape measure protein [Sphingomonas aracearum]RDE04811.1 tail tape measure protein [Sphingomonas aracearum]